MKNKKGFTLVELLAVIVILAVLLVVATPMVFNAIKDSKKKTKCKVVKEVATIYKSYAYTNKTKPCVQDNKCYFKDLISDGYLDSKITSPITGDEIGSEITKLYVTPNGCKEKTLYTDKNGISVCYDNTYDEATVDVLADNDVSDLAEFCK